MEVRSKRSKDGHFLVVVVGGVMKKIVPARLLPVKPVGSMSAWRSRDMTFQRQNRQKPANLHMVVMVAAGPR